MIFDYFRIVLNSLFRRRMRAWLTMIGIFIGIAAVVSLISLGSGLKTAITGQFAGIGTDKITVQAAGTSYGPPGSTALVRLTEHDARAINKVKGTDMVVPRLLRTVKVEFKKKIVYAYAASMPTDTRAVEIVMSMLKADVADGRMLKKDDKYKIVVGNDFKSKKKFERKLKLGDTLDINGYDMEIVGILERAGSIFGNDLILMNHDTMKDVVDSNDEVDIIVVQVQSDTSIEGVSDDITKLLRKRRDVKRGEEDFSVSTPLEMIDSLNSILSAVQWFLVGVAGISLIVGGVGIMNTMYTSVLERRKEIGIMKSIGAKNSNVLLIFIIEAGFLGMVGGIIGILVGIGLAKLVEILGSNALGEGFIQADFSLLLIGGALLFSFGVGILSGVLPAFQASRLNPVDALRK